MKTFLSEQLLQISLVMLAPITTGIAVLSNELETIYKEKIKVKGLIAKSSYHHS